MIVVFGCASAPYYPVRWKTAIERWMASRTSDLQFEWMPAWSANHSFNLNRLIQACRDRDDVDWFASIETDIIPRVSPGEVADLLEEHHAAGRHIVSSGVQLEGELEHPEKRVFAFDGRPNGEKWFPVDRTSLGFVFFSLEALKALRVVAEKEQWGRLVQYYCTEIDRVGDEVIVGLDYSLCERARQVGYPCYVDQRLRTIHMKEIGYPSYPGDGGPAPVTM